MTANAMAGDRDRCIQAGMNDHVPKPIDPEGLFRTLLEWIPAGERDPLEASIREGDSQPGAHRERSSATPTTSESDAIAALSAIDGFDAESGLKRVMGKRDFYEQLVRGFAEGDEAKSVAAIRDLLAHSDEDAAERTAHSLKGVAGTLGAEELRSRAEGLEAAIREGHQRVQIDDHLSSVQQELDRLLSAIKSALGTEAPEDHADAMDYDPSTVENIPALIEALTDKQERAKELSSTQTINDVEEFAREMCASGKEAGYPTLVIWADELERSASMFDMDGMSKALESYPDLIEKAKKLAEGS